MGSVHAPAPVDIRVEKCMKTFGIPQKKVEELWHIFTRFDISGSGYLPLDEFFLSIIKYPRNPLTDAVPSFMGTKSDATINFGEFVDIICTFACFEQMDLLRFMFFIVDPQRVGVVEKHEIKLFFIRVWHNEPYKDVQEAMEYLEATDDNVYRFQQCIIDHTLGEVWWENHKADLKDAKQAQQERELKLAKKKKKEQDRALDLVSEEALQQKMGIRYYLMPWQIPRERKRLIRIAAIEKDLDRQVEDLDMTSKVGDRSRARASSSSSLTAP